MNYFFDFLHFFPLALLNGFFVLVVVLTCRTRPILFYQGLSLQEHFYAHGLKKNHFMLKQLCRKCKCDFYLSQTVTCENRCYFPNKYPTAFIKPGILGLIYLKQVLAICKSTNCQNREYLARLLIKQQMTFRSKFVLNSLLVVTALCLKM